jgi:hypothetical protein
VERNPFKGNSGKVTQERNPEKRTLKTKPWKENSGNETLEWKPLDLFCRKLQCLSIEIDAPPPSRGTR